MNRIFIFLFTLGLIYFARFESFTFIFQKLIIPITFLFFFLKNPYLILNISILSLYFLFVLLASTSFVHSINMERTLRFFQLMIGAFMLLYIYVVILLYDPGVLKYILYAFIFSAILFVFTIDFASASIISDRRTGITSNPNLFGMFMLYSIFGAALLWKDATMKMKVFLLGVVLLSLYGIIAAASRKSLISAAVFMFLWVLVLYLNERNIVKILFFSLLLGVVSYVFYIEFYVDSIMMARLEYIDQSSEGRFDIAIEGFRLFKSSPIIGLGLGSFQEYSNSGKYAHNDFFELLATMGIIGLLIYTSIYYWLIRMIRTIKKNTVDKNIKYRLNLLLVIIVTMVVLGLGRPHFFDIFSMSIFGIIAGYTYGVGLKMHKLNEYKLLVEK